MKSAIWLIATAQTLLWGALYYLFPAMLLQWEEHYGWSRAELTLALALAVVVSAVFAPLAGKLVDKGHGAVMQPLSALGGSLCLFMLPSISSLEMFYLIWGVIGFFMAGCLYEACFAFIVRHQSDDAKRSITMITLVAGFASTICFPLARVFSEQFGVGIAVQIFAGSIIFIAVPMFWIGAKQLEKNTPTSHTETTSAEEHGDTSYLRRPAFWLLAASFSLLTINHGVVLNHLLPILADWQVEDSFAVLAISMIGPMQVTGRLMWMIFDRHLNIPLVTMACFVGITLATLCLIFSADTLWLLAGFVVLQGAAYGVICIVKPLITREIMGEKNFGTISGAMALPYLTCFAASPYIGSLIWQWKGYTATLWSIWGFALAGLACLAITLLLEQRQKPITCCSDEVSLSHSATR